MINPFKFLLTCYLILLFSASFAQDSIFFRTKLIETGKVSQIGGGTVLMMPDTFFADDIVVKYRASKIHKIKYASGRTDTVWGNPLYQNTANIFANYELGQKHTLDISLYNLRYMEVKMQYAYYHKKRNLCFTIPINFINKNYDGRDSRALLRSRFSTGLVVRAFANRQSKFSFYAGIGTLMGYSNLYTYQGSSGYYSKTNRYFVNPFINLGYQHYLNQILFLAINGSFGPSFYFYHRKLDESIFALEVRLGCKIK